MHGAGPAASEGDLVQGRQINKTQTPCLSNQAPQVSHKSLERLLKLLYNSIYIYVYLSIGACRRRSQLIVRHFNSSTDAGKYECRAKNKVSNTIDKRRIMISAHPGKTFNSLSIFPSIASRFDVRLSCFG